VQGWGRAIRCKSSRLQAFRYYLSRRGHRTKGKIFKEAAIEHNAKTLYKTKNQLSDYQSTVQRLSVNYNYSNRTLSNAT